MQDKSTKGRRFTEIPPGDGSCVNESVAFDRAMKQKLFLSVASLGLGS